MGKHGLVPPTLHTVNPQNSLFPLLLQFSIRDYSRPQAAPGREGEDRTHNKINHLSRRLNDQQSSYWTFLLNKGNFLRLLGLVGQTDSTDEGLGECVENAEQSAVLLGPPIASGCLDPLSYLPLLMTLMRRAALG